MDEDKNRALFHQLLLEHIDKIKQEISPLKELTKPIAPDNAIGRLSRMDAINMKSINEAALRTAQRRLAKLELALRHIDSGEFGYCTHCGEAIAHRRLLLMPESTQCVKCAE